MLGGRIVEAFNTSGQACYFALERDDCLPDGWSLNRAVWPGAASYGQVYLNDRATPRCGVAKPHRNSFAAPQLTPAQELATGEKKLFLLEPGQALPLGWRYLDEAPDWHARPLTVGEDGEIEPEEAQLRRLDLLASVKPPADTYELDRARAALDVATEAYDKAKMDYDRACFEGE